MHDKLNCWEFKNCGREKGGLLADTLGECPVATSMKHDGMNEGKAGGRVCWMVAAKDIGGRLPISCRGGSCHQCDFYRRVNHEQAEKFQGRLATAIVK